MGNPYRNMAKRNLTWRFFHEVEENSEAFPIVIDESKSVSELGKKIKEKVKELKSDICSDLDDGDLDLRLWKVNISNSDVDKFSSLRLQNDESKGIEKLEGINLIVNIGVINQNLKEKIKELTENIENMSFQSENFLIVLNRELHYNSHIMKKIVSEGNNILYNNIKVTALKVTEGWAYIEYENEYFTSITEFIKKKEIITYPPVLKQRDLLPSAIDLIRIYVGFWDQNYHKEGGNKVVKNKYHQ
ncbi:43158_t:CDS:2 [Gigaspora margarita]|uniref:43158_t:CDS:1 n=1 Tax=Gigaspora margarita TaxID=4874 RepID=A0ABN7UVI0_GIGMA|nr:43158_t:CDS:2 [Gigaspora margarita]